MPFRFFRRTKIAPGVSLNLSKSGASVSLGPRGAKVTVGARGVRKTAGIPGTGMYWTEHSGYDSGSGRRRSRRTPAPAPNVAPEDRLSLGFFKRLFTPQNEEAFVDGMREFVNGNEAAALRHFEQANDLADAAFMAGVLLLKQENFSAAQCSLTAAKQNQARLGHYCEKYDVQATATLAITDHVAAIIGPDLRGTLLALAECHQHLGRPKDSIGELRQLYRRDPDDIVVRLSLAELLVETGGSKRNCQTVVRLAQGIKNASEIHTGLMYYKAKALRKLGLLTAAREAVTAALRREKDRSDELLRSLRYERAMVYNGLGWEKRYRKTLEKLYAEAPGYEDVAARLGLG